MCILPQLNKCQGTEGDEELCSRQREQCVQKLGNEKEICISLRSFSYQEQRREGIRSFLSFPWIQSLPWGGSEIAQVCLWNFTTSLLILFFSSLFFLQLIFSCSSKPSNVPQLPEMFQLLKLHLFPNLPTFFPSHQNFQSLRAAVLTKLGGQLT